MQAYKRGMTLDMSILYPRAIDALLDDLPHVRVQAMNLLKYVQ